MSYNIHITHHSMDVDASTDINVDTNPDTNTDANPDTDANINATTIQVPVIVRAANTAVTITDTAFIIHHNGRNYGTGQLCDKCDAVLKAGQPVHMSAYGQPYVTCLNCYVDSIFKGYTDRLADGTVVPRADFAPADESKSRYSPCSSVLQLLPQLQFEHIQQWLSPINRQLCSLLPQHFEEHFGGYTLVKDTRSRAFESSDVSVGFKCVDHTLVLAGPCSVCSRLTSPSLGQGVDYTNGNIECNLCRHQRMCRQYRETGDLMDMFVIAANFMVGPYKVTAEENPGLSEVLADGDILRTYEDVLMDYERLKDLANAFAAEYWPLFQASYPVHPTLKTRAAIKQQQLWHVSGDYTAEVVDGWGRTQLQIRRGRDGYYLNFNANIDSTTRGHENSQLFFGSTNGNMADLHDFLAHIHKGPAAVSVAAATTTPAVACSS